MSLGQSFNWSRLYVLHIGSNHRLLKLLKYVKASVKDWIFTS